MPHEPGHALTAAERQAIIDRIVAAGEQADEEVSAEDLATLRASSDQELIDSAPAQTSANSPQALAQQAARAELNRRFLADPAGFGEETWRAVDAWIQRGESGRLLALDPALIPQYIDRQVRVARVASRADALVGARQDQLQYEQLVRDNFTNAWNTRVLGPLRTISAGLTEASDEEMAAAAYLLEQLDDDTRFEATYRQFRAQADEVGRAILDGDVEAQAAAVGVSLENFTAWESTRGPAAFLLGSLDRIWDEALPGSAKVAGSPALDVGKAVKRDLVPFNQNEQRVEAALVRLEKLFKAFEEDALQGYLTLGQHALKSGRYAAALTTLQESRQDILKRYAETVRAGTALPPQAFFDQELAQPLGVALRNSPGVAGATVLETFMNLGTFESPAEITARETREVEAAGKQEAGLLQTQALGQLRQISQVGGYTAEQEAGAQAQIAGINAGTFDAGAVKQFLDTTKEQKGKRASLEAIIANQRTDGRKYSARQIADAQAELEALSTPADAPPGGPAAAPGAPGAPAAPAGPGSAADAANDPQGDIPPEVAAAYDQWLTELGRGLSPDLIQTDIKRKVIPDLRTFANAVGTGALVPGRGAGAGQLAADPLDVRIGRTLGQLNDKFYGASVATIGTRTPVEPPPPAPPPPAATVTPMTPPGPGQPGGARSTVDVNIAQAQTSAAQRNAELDLTPEERRRRIEAEDPQNAGVRR